MMASIPVRRNSAYGHSETNAPAVNKSIKSSSVRRTQSMRYAKRQNSNGVGVGGSPLSRSQKISSIPERVGPVDNGRVSMSDNGSDNQNTIKSNGKFNANAHNYIIAKDLDHFKNERVFRVLVVGTPDSGKTSLISQFSYFLEENHRQTPLSLSKNNSSLQYLILNFREIPSLDHCFPRSPITVYQPDAYIVVYAVNDRESFDGAKQLISEIHKWDDIESKPVILVANKTDLVRSRTVTKQEGRHVAISNNCKYIETSVTISHNIDFLLTGIGAQINLKSNSKQNGHISTRKPNLFKRLLRKAALNKSKSCDNLHVL